MQLLDYITLILFTVGIVIAGISFSSTGKSMKSFFAGGGNVPWWIGGLSLFMGFFSAGTFVVWGSIAYSHGLVAITIQYTMAIAGFAVGTLFAPRWNRTGCLTAAEYISGRYGVPTQKMYTVLFLFISLFTTGSFLYPIARIINVTTGMPLATSILALGAFGIIYVSIGGLRSVVVTDVIQFIILVAAVVIVIPLSFMKVGGVSNFLTAFPKEMHQIVAGEYSWPFIIAFTLYNSFFLGGNWAYVQRYTSVSGEKDAKKVGWLFGSLYLICPILWMLPPMIYRIINPGLSGIETENAFLLMCKEAMPSGLLGLMLGGMVFATASSFNATLNISAGVVTNDIYKRIKPDASERNLIGVAKVSTVLFGMLAVIVALLIPKMGGIVNVVISVAALTGVPLYLPLLWSLFSTNLNGKAISFVTLASLFVNACFKFVTPLFGLSLNRANEMLVGVAVPIFLLVVYEIIHAIFIPDKKIPFPVRRGEHIKEGEADNKYSIKVIGIAALVAGAFITFLGAVGESHRLVPLTVGFCLLGLSAVCLINSVSKE